MIILRTTAICARVRAFGVRLEAASGMPTVILVDARSDDSAIDDCHKLPLDRASIEAAGLYCPSNFAWKCGDYGFYLARNRFPDRDYYWMIEFDVRFSDDGLEAFFRHFSGISSDFLASHMQVALPDWYWTPFAAARKVTPYRCLFPIVRLSGAAIDLLLEKRREHSRQRLRRVIWPNDEAFVATTLYAAGMECRDINAHGMTFYDRQSLGFFEPIEGARFDRDMAGEAPFRIFHPVLYDDDYRKKQEKLRNYVANPKRMQKRAIKAMAFVNRMRRW